MIRGEYFAASATLLVVLTATGCGEMRVPGEPTLVSVGGRDGTAPAPSPGRVVVAGGDAAWGDDDYVLNCAAITGDTLTVSVSYAGGCRAHAFTLVIAASFIGSSQVRLPTVLRHEANGDPCEAFPTESYVFDLALVRARYRAVYGPGPGRVALQLDGVPVDGLVYEFTGRVASLNREARRSVESLRIAAWPGGPYTPPSSQSSVSALHCLTSG